MAFTRYKLTHQTHAAVKISEYLVKLAEGANTLNSAIAHRYSDKSIRTSIDMASLVVICL